jgi:hypothetical protein
MVRACRLAELFFVLAQSSCTKARQSRATNRDVSLGGKSCYGCMKQQNDLFVLRFAVVASTQSCSYVGVPQAIPLPRSSPALSYRRTRDVFHNTALQEKKPCTSLTLTDMP